MKKGVLLGLLVVALVLVAVLLLLPVGYFDQDSTPAPVMTPAVPVGAASPPGGAAPMMGPAGSGTPAGPASVDPMAVAPNGQALPPGLTPTPANPELVERAIEQAERELHTQPDDSSNAAIPCDNDISATSDCPAASSSAHRSQ